jgi:putative inorganic carbon (HCO3(-)) transporter
MRDFFLTAFVFCIAPVALIRPWVGIVGFFWLGFMNPHKLSWGFARGMPYAQMLAVCTLAGLLFTKDKKSIPWTTELVIMVLLAGYFTFTTFFAWAPGPAWVQWEKVMKIYFMTFIMTMLIYDRYKIHILLLISALSIGFFGFKGGIFTLTSGGANHVLGPEGTFIEGNTFLGLAMLMVLPLLVFLAREENRKWVKRGLYVTAGLTCVSIIFTYSRGAMVGLAVVFPLLFLKARGKMLFLLVFLPVAYIGYQWAPQQIFQRAELISDYQEDRSAMQRWQAWSVSWNVALSHPLTGGGFELEYTPDKARWLSYANRKYDRFGDEARAAHSSYFQILGQHGLIAFILFLIFIWALMLRLWRLRKMGRIKPEYEWFANYADALLIGMTGYLVSGAFLNAAYFDLMYVFAGIAAILQRAANEALRDEKKKSLTAASAPTVPPAALRHS